MFFLLREETGSKKSALVRDLVSEGLLTLALAFVLAFVLISFSSLGWFAPRDHTTADNMTVAAKRADYILYVDRTTEYDRLVNGNPLYPGISDLKTLLNTGLGYSFTADSTEEEPLLAMELVNESAVWVEGVDEYFLMPGSYGTLTFYIEPRMTGAFETDLLLDIGCFNDDFDEYDNPVITEVTNEHVLRLLQGHILFFTERTGSTIDDFRYDGLIENGLFHFSTEGQSKVPGEDYYEITLYWEWPITFFEIDENLSTTAPAVTRRFPAELRTYIGNNRDAFFAANENSMVVDLLNDGYNDGDQIIGENADYFVVYICNSF